MSWLGAIIGLIPTGLVLICTVLSALIPYATYRLNHALNDSGAPPWKREERNQP